MLVHELGYVVDVAVDYDPKALLGLAVLGYLLDCVLPGHFGGSGSDWRGGGKRRGGGGGEMGRERTRVSNADGVLDEEERILWLRL